MGLRVQQQVCMSALNETIIVQKWRMEQAAGAWAVDRAIGKLGKQSRLLLLHPSASVRLCLYDGPKQRDVIKARRNLSLSQVLTGKTVSEVCGLVETP